jgi:hypothetical protein
MDFINQSLYGKVVNFLDDMKYIMFLCDDTKVPEGPHSKSELI